MREQATASRWSVASISAVVTAVAGVLAAVAALVSAGSGNPVWLIVVGGFALVVAAVTVAIALVRRTMARREFAKRVLTSPYLREMRLVGADTWGMKLDIEQIYQDVSLSREVHWNRDTVHTFGTTPKPGERHRLESFLDSGAPTVIAIWGIPGSGKSTLLRHTTLLLARQRGRRKTVPLLIVLAHHVDAIAADSTIGMAEIAASARWLDGSAVRAIDVKRWLRRGRCLVMLDGLDEVPAEQRHAVIQWVEREAERYRGFSLVITSRPHGFASASLDNADVLLEVRELTDAQITGFVHAVYRAMSTDERQGVTDPKQQADDLLRRLRDQPKLHELASNPLLLHLIVYVHHNRSSGLPSDRVELYRDLVQLLVHKRRESAGVATSLSAEAKLVMVEVLALHMMDHERTELDAGVVETALREASIDVDTDAFLNEVRDNGILVPTGRRSWTFAHLTLQEYLAARRIADIGDPGRLIDNLDKPWWRETTLLWASDNDPSRVIAAGLERVDIDGWEIAVECARLAEDRGIAIGASLKAEVERVVSGDFPVDSRKFEVSAGLAARADLSPKRKPVIGKEADIV